MVKITGVEQDLKDCCYKCINYYETYDNLFECKKGYHYNYREDAIYVKCEFFKERK